MTGEVEIAYGVFVSLSSTFPIKLKDPTIKSLQEWREAFYWKYISNSTYVSSFGNNRNLGIKENASSVLFTKYTIRTSETTTKEVSTLWPKDYYQGLEAFFNGGEVDEVMTIPLLSNLITLRDGSYDTAAQNTDLLGALWEDLDFSWYLNKSFSQYWISLLAPYKNMIGAEGWEAFVYMIQSVFSISTIWDVYTWFTMQLILPTPYFKGVYVNMSKVWPIQYKVGWFCTELLAGSVAPTYDMPIIPIGALRSYVTKLLQLGRIKDEANLYSIVKVLGSENKMSYLMATYLYDMIGAEGWEAFVYMIQSVFSISTIWDVYTWFTMQLILPTPYFKGVYVNMSKVWPIQYKVGWFCTELLAGSVAPTYDMPIIPIGALRSYVTKLLQLGRIKDEANLYSIVKVLGSENKMSYLMATYLYDMMYPSKIICTGISTNRSREPYAQTKYGVLPAWDMSLIPEDMKDTYDADVPTCAYIIKLDYPSINSTELPKDMIVTTKIVNLITGETIADNPEDFWQSWLKHTKDVKSAL